MDASTPPPVRYQVECQALDGVAPHLWQPFCKPFATRAEADEHIAWAKALDARPPVGRYNYRIVEVSGE